MLEALQHILDPRVDPEVRGGGIEGGGFTCLRGEGKLLYLGIKGTVQGDF